MTITVSDEMRLATLQQEFSQWFPYLLLQFMRGKSRGQQPGSSTLSEYRITKDKEVLVIGPQMTVRELENSFRERYGLAVFVLRKSGSVWLETTLTSSWTLKEQNRQGEELSRKDR